MCDYSDRVHYTPDAREYHMDQCRAEWMAKMADERKCVSYMTGIADGSLAGCSIAQLQDICRERTNDFTVSDAERLCQYQNAAMALFWHEKNAARR